MGINSGFLKNEKIINIISRGGNDHGEFEGEQIDL
jgi:hypothetical protein